MPNFLANSVKLGNDVATLAQLFTRISPDARNAAMVNDMAMR